MGLTRVFLIFLLITTVFSSAEGPSDAISGKTADFKASKGKSENLLYIYFGGEGQLLMNGAQKVFNNGFQAGLNWMGVGGCISSLCADYEITYFFSKNTGEDHIVNDTLYNRENADVRLSLLLEWRSFYTPYFDVRAYVGYHWNAYSFKIDSDYDVDKNHQYNNIVDFGDFSLGGMIKHAGV